MYVLYIKAVQVKDYIEVKTMHIEKMVCPLPMPYDSGTIRQAPYENINYIKYFLTKNKDESN